MMRKIEWLPLETAMKRLVLTLLFSLSTMLLGASATAQDAKELVDTGKGVKFQKASGWAEAAKKKGTVAVLKAAGDERSEVEFRWSQVEGNKVKQYFNSFHASLTGAGLKRVDKGKQAKYGGVDGRLTEYEAANADGTTTSVYVYEFSAANGAWLVVGMFLSEEKAKRFAELESMLKTIAVGE